MESIKEIFKIGRGPSSSHTMGPFRAACLYRKKHPRVKSFRVTLCGSLALTGKGHLTDKAVKEGLKSENVDIVWKGNEKKAFHSNALEFEVAQPGENPDKWLVYSIGGGKIVEDENKYSKPELIYKQKSMTEIIDTCTKNKITLWKYVFGTEKEKIEDYLKRVWETMQTTIERGLTKKEILPGGLNLKRRAAIYFERSESLSGHTKATSRLFSYALAAAEENASGGEVVTAPTCGSAGILPAILKTIKENYKIDDKDIIRSLATAGLVGNLVKHNASISGAEVGCQGEVGTACAMAAAAAAQLLGGSLNQIEYAAEMGLEHHLGLTCDPVKGLVQIPCIERNAHAAARALDCALYSLMSDGKHYISFDIVVKVMKKTGKDLPSLYKETSLGGLAAFVRGF